MLQCTPLKGVFGVQNPGSTLHAARLRSSRAPLTWPSIEIQFDLHSDHHHISSCLHPYPLFTPSSHSYTTSATLFPVSDLSQRKATDATRHRRSLLWLSKHTSMSSSQQPSPTPGPSSGGRAVRPIRPSPDFYLWNRLPGIHILVPLQGTHPHPSPHPRPLTATQASSRTQRTSAA